MGRFNLLPFLGLLAIGYTARCPSQKSQPEREILCYTSSIDLKLLENSICRCTTLVYRGHDLQHLNASGLQGIRESLKDVNPGIEFIVSINDHQGSLRTCAGARQQAIARISSIFNEVDGLELNVTAGTKERLVHFIQGLKEEMIRKSKEGRIFLALPTKEELLAKEVDVKKLAKYVDLFTLPTHYLTDDEGFKTFHPSRLMGLLDLLNTDSLVDLIHSLGVDKRKIIISLPASGYKFTLRDKNNNVPGAPTIDEKPSIINRKELCDMIQQGEWTIERDEDLTAPYAFNNFTWIAFEDKISTRIKGKYVLLRDLAGLAIDQIENDSEACGRSITEEVYHSFVDNERKTREAVLNSLQKDIDNTENSYPNSIKASNFRISRIVDSEGKIHSIRENMQTEFSCPRQGYFVHPKSCNRFYRCVKFNQEVEDYSVFEFDCPSGLAFDERTEVCVWPGSLSEGSPCPGSSEIAPTTPRRFRCPGEGYYADPNNCRWFFSCVNLGEDQMTPYEFRCPYGLVFDERKLVCEWPWMVPNCAGNNYEHNGGDDKGYGGLGPGVSTQSGNRKYNKSTKNDGYRLSPESSQQGHDDSSHYQHVTSPIPSDYSATEDYKGYGGLGPGVSTQSGNRKYNKSTKNDVYRFSQGSSQQGHDDSSQYHVTSPIPRDFITTIAPESAFTPTPLTENKNFNTLTSISPDNYPGYGNKFIGSQSTTENTNSYESIGVTSVNSVPEIEKLNPSESHFQTNFGKFSTSSPVVSINPQFVDIGGIPNAPGTLSDASISIGNEYYVNQAGKIGVKAQSKYYPTSVSNSFSTFEPTEKYYPNQLGIKTQFPYTPSFTTGGIPNNRFNKNPWLGKTSGDRTYFTNKNQLGGVTPPGLSTGFQYSPSQYETPSYTPGLGVQGIFSTAGTRGKIPVDYTVKIPDGANGNQFFQNHASVNPIYKGNPFLSPTSITSNGNQFSSNYASVIPRYQGNPFLPSTSVTSSGNEYYTNQAGNDASTLSRPNKNGYKTNEYYDNGGRSTIRYNNGSVAYKFTEDDLRNGKVSFPAAASSIFVNQTPRPIIGISNNGIGPTRVKSGGTTGSYIVGVNGPKPITNPYQIGGNAFTGSTLLRENSKNQLYLSTTPKFMSSKQIFDDSMKSSGPIKTATNSLNDGIGEENSVNDGIGKLTTQQPSFFDIQVDVNNKPMVTTPEPVLVNTIFSESSTAQYPRPFSVSSTVEPIEYATERLSNDGYRIEVSSTSIPISINTGKYRNDGFSSVGIGDKTVTRQKNPGNTSKYNGVSNPGPTIPSSTIYQKQNNNYGTSTRIDEEGYAQTFGEKIITNKNEINQQKSASVRPGIRYSASSTSATPGATYPNTPVNVGHSFRRPIQKSSENSNPAVTGNPSIPLKEVSKQRNNNYNRGNSKYIPSDDYDESSEVSEHIITTQQPPVTTYNGGYKDSLTVQSSQISKMDNGGAVVIKYSDLRPILLEKLGAECTCKSDPFAGFRSNRPLLINSSKGSIDLRDYNESDIYVDLELNKKSGEKPFLTSTLSPKNSRYETSVVSVFNSGIRSTMKPGNRPAQSPSDIAISASFNVNKSQSRGAKNLTPDENHFPEIGSLDDAMCARPGLFRHPKFCNKFYVCHWDQREKKFTLSVSDCPVHLTFDSHAGACNLPSQGPACQVDHLLV